MPVLEQSDAWATLCRNRLSDSYNSTDSVWETPLYGNPSSSSSARGELRVYKGTAPDPSVWWTSRAQYDSDLLLKWRREGTSQMTIAYPAVNSLSFNSATPVAASQSGTATWCAWITSADSGGSQFMQAIGTVGVAGSGADLELPTVVLTSGLFYTFSNLVFVFPKSWTY